jgi:poly(hydroxyalkanoate) depolymerase family esterase
MLTYAPRGLSAKAPLVVVLHGCTQNGPGYAAASGWLELAARWGFALLVPEQTPANNPNRCFNWFEAQDVSRGSGEAASIRAMTEKMVKDHDIDRSRVFVTGLSAGGALAAALLAAYPDVYAAGAVIGGVPVGIADGVSSAFAAMRSGPTISAATLGARLRAAGDGAAGPPRLAIWHGDADTTVAPANAEGLARQWIAALDLPETPSRSETMSGRVRRTWGGPAPKDALLEINIVHGLAHGTPLATKGPDGLGTPAPFMLEAGISSTLEIAAFFGIAPSRARGAEETIAPEAPTPHGPATRPQRARAPTSPAGVVSTSLKGLVPDDVHSKIMKALKSAGLH